MATIVKAAAAFNEVLRQAESIRNDDHHTVKTMSPGDAWAQGDLGLVALESLPANCKRDPNPSAQLAPGDTQGSRHCVDDLSTVTLYRLGNPTPLDGPIIDAPAGVRVNHPEHGDVTLPPGVYAVVYQRAFADELRAVQD